MNFLKLISLIEMSLRRKLDSREMGASVCVEIPPLRHPQEEVQRGKGETETCVFMAINRWTVRFSYENFHCKQWSKMKVLKMQKLSYNQREHIILLLPAKYECKTPSTVFVSYRWSSKNDTDARKNQFLVSGWGGTFALICLGQLSIHFHPSKSPVPRNNNDDLQVLP